MRLFYEYFKDINEVRERRFRFEEFGAGTATIIIPPNTPNKGTITTSATKRTIQRYILRDKKTGEILRKPGSNQPKMRSEIQEFEENLNLAYEITTDPFDGPKIRNFSGSYLQYLKLKGYFNGMPIIPRPPRIKKDGNIEEEFNRETTIIMDGKKMDNTRISVDTIFYFSSKNLHEALKDVRQEDIEPTSRPETSPRPGQFKSTIVSKNKMSGTIMSPSEIVNWSIEKIAKTIENALRSSGINKAMIKNNLIVFLDRNGNKKAFKVIPPSPNFIRNKWLNGEWKIVSSDKQVFNLMSSRNEQGMNFVTSGILPNLGLLANKIQKMIE